VAQFLTSSFGAFVIRLFSDIFTVPSARTFALLAWGWALAEGRRTITAYLWVTGAALLKHFSRFYVFLGSPFYAARGQVWARIIRHAARLVPAGDPIMLVFDDTTKKKAGRHIEGVDRYRNNAGSARQEYRTLRGVNFVLGTMLVPTRLWPGHQLAVPIGLEVYLREERARKLQVLYHSHSALARAMVDRVAQELPERQLRVLGDRSYATKEFVRALPAAGHVLLRFLITSKLYAPPELSAGPRRGRRPQKGPLIGSPKTLARKRHGWQPHPTEAEAEVQAWVGWWHPVLPERPVRVVVVRRPAARRGKRPGQRKPRPPVEAFFTTDLTLSVDEILQNYRTRWAIEIAIRDAYTLAGLGQDQCRKFQRIVGVNTFCLVMTAGRTLWFLAQAREPRPVNLRWGRPWYWQKAAPSQLDVSWACREGLHEAGISPIVHFAHTLTENHETPETSLPLAA
jgi:hypothetical protein